MVELKESCFSLGICYEFAILTLRCPEIHIAILIFFSLHGLSTRANYTDRATAACRQSDFQLLRIEGAM
jgi:hypothetical protein